MPEIDVTDDRTTGSAPGAELAQAVARLRRVLRRSVRRDGVDPLTPSASEVLVLAAERPGIGVSEVADELRMAPNTVSTLVRRLVDAGLLVRTTDPSDRRAARLRATGAARARIARYRADRAVRLDAALARLDADERALLARAVPALRRLAEVLDAGTGAAGGPGRTGAHVDVTTAAGPPPDRSYAGAPSAGNVR